MTDQNHLIDLGMDHEAEKVIRQAAWNRKKAKRKKRDDYSDDHDEPRTKRNRKRRNYTNGRNHSAAY